MKIIGGIGSSGLGFVSAVLVTPLLKINAPIRFYVDTGACRTVISDSDAQRLGIDIKKLKKYPNSVQGVGGTVESYNLPESMLVFRFSDCMHIEYLDNAMVLGSPKRSLDKFVTPNLLGIDILKNYSVHFTNQKVILEK